MINFEERLNKEQYDGVRTTEGPVLVLAGAGSGKTRLLTHKIAFLIKELGIDPGSILAVTFTNKAAKEMKERVEELLEMNVKKLWIGTFHSLCGRMLRTFADSVGLTSDYTVYDRDDSIRLIRNILDEMGFDRKEMNPKSLIAQISGLKDELTMPEDFLTQANTLELETLYNIYSRYQNALIKNNSVDFDDMIIHVVNTFKSNHDIRDKWSSRFQYVLVDEFQDTNVAQYELVRLLSSSHGNITVVGDDDQSIYSWRGAKITNILNFHTDFKNTHIVKLEQNYRSTQHILSAAGKMVEKNADRHEKNLWSDLGDGEKVRVLNFSEDRAEAESIAKEIKETIAKGDVSPQEIAILYRINYISRIFEERIRSHSIPYEVVGGFKFYERAEIKDIMSYLRLIVNPKDDLAFMRVVNQPRRGVGQTSMENLIDHARDLDISLLELSCQGNLECRLSSKAKAGIAGFAQLITGIREKLEDLTVPEIIETIIDASGYAAMLQEDGSEEAQNRLENLEELFNSASEFVEINPDDPSLNAFLEQTSLLSDIDNADTDSEKINLMTIHAAKGLEFEHVYVVALEDGTFPIVRDDSPGNIDEERRLLYVAITRGKKRVSLSWSSERTRFGDSQPQVQSRFLEEIPEEFLAEVSLKKKQRFTVGKPVVKKSQKLYKPRMRVSHPFFGKGLIIKVRGSGEKAILTVNFKDHGVKKLVAGLAKLEILG